MAMVSVNGVSVDVSTMKAVDELVVYNPSLVSKVKSAITEKLSKISFRNLETEQLEMALNELNLVVH